VFTLPEDLTQVDDLSVILKEATDRYNELAAIDEAALTDDDVNELVSLASGVQAITAENDSRQAAVDARAQVIADSKAAMAAATAPAEESAEEEAAETPAEEAAEEAVEPVDTSHIPDDAREITEKEPIMAAARKPIAKAVARRAPKPEAEPLPERPKAGIVAAAGVPDFNIGQDLKDIDGMTAAFQARLQGFPTVGIEGAPTQRYGVAKIFKAVDKEFSLERGDQEGNFLKIVNASKSQSVGGAKQGLVAAGGWCAPSEVIYDIPADETVNGILSLPEVTVKRGGISFTRGPDFSDIYAAEGFTQTEAQAVAGTVKNFVDVTCPPFSEVRMDVIGFGVRAGILTNTAWPELVKRYLSGTLVAHQHKVNASKINRVLALLPSAIDGTAAVASKGSAAADVLTLLDRQATGLRYKYRLADNARIEGFAPIWLIGVIRSDMAYQDDVDTKAITDAQINSWLAARNIYLQWVHDYAELPTTVNALWPTTVTVALYPTGTFVAGTTDVISMDAVYDTAGLSVNTFTAAFFEEGLMVFSPKLSGVQINIGLHYAGRSGAYDITG
jgi:hypothetical protein